MTVFYSKVNGTHNALNCVFVSLLVLVKSEHECNIQLFLCSDITFPKLGKISSRLGK